MRANMAQGKAVVRDMLVKPEFLPLMSVASQSPSLSPSPVRNLYF